MGLGIAAGWFAIGQGIKLIELQEIGVFHLLLVTRVDRRFFVYET